jgi:hypothetical protein
MILGVWCQRSFPVTSPPATYFRASSSFRTLIDGESPGLAARTGRHARHRWVHGDLEDLRYAIRLSSDVEPEVPPAIRAVRSRPHDALVEGEVFDHGARVVDEICHGDLGDS